jgi:ribosomal protein S18 acetylase RimI-like enzyme
MLHIHPLAERSAPMYAIRPGTVADAEQLIAFDHVAQVEPERRASIQRAIAAGANYVATAEGAIVGYGELEYSFYHNGFVALLYVHPEHRRRGVGVALMRHFESICTTAKLFTSTNLSNLPMQSLLAKLGYTLTGVVDNLDEGDPELIYFKRVATDAASQNSAQTDTLAAGWSEWRDQMNAMIDARTDMAEADREDMKAQVAKIQAEASKGAQADPGRLEKLINTLAVLGPDIFEVAVATLESPLKGIGLALKKLSDRAKIKRTSSS